MATTDELNARRAARRAEHDKARAEQEQKDLEAIDALEVEAGEPLSVMTARGFKPGVPVKLAFRTPNAGEYKRYVDQITRSASVKNAPAERLRAQTMLAESCWLYPAKDSPERASMLDAFPGLHVSLCIEAAKAAELAAEDEGKD